MALTPDIIATRIRVDNAEAKRKLREFTDETKKSAKQASKSFSDMRAAAAKAAVPLAALVGGFAAIDKFAKEADAVTSLNRAFQTLSQRIGSTSDEMLRKLRPAARGLVSDLDLMQQANNAIILGLPITADSFAELTDLAVTLGRAVGQGPTAAIESMTTGIGRQSRMMLDNLGIIVDTQAAYDTYAESVGKSTAELTVQEQKLAFYNATLTSAREKVQGLSEDSRTLSEAWASAKVELKNYTDETLRLINVAGTGELQGIVEFLAKDFLFGPTRDLFAALKDDPDLAEGFLLTPSLDEKAVKDKVMEALVSPSLSFRENIEASAARISQLEAEGRALRESFADGTFQKEFREQFDAAAIAAEKIKSDMQAVKEILAPSGEGALQVSPGDVAQDDVAGLGLEGILPPQEYFEIYGNQTQELTDLITAQRAERAALTETETLALEQYASYEAVLDRINQLQVALAASGGKWTEEMQKNAEAALTSAAANQELAAQQQLVQEVVNATTEAVFALTSAQDFSAKSIAQSLLKQLIKIVVRYAQSATAVGAEQSVKGTAAAADGDAGGAARHFAAAGIAFAGAAAIAALGTLGGSGSSGGRGSAASGNIYSPEVERGETYIPPDTRTQEIRVFIENGAYVQDVDAFAADIVDAIENSSQRTGQRTGSSAD